MATQLPDLVNAISAGISTAPVTGFPGLTTAIGAEFLARQDAPPRIVWVPMEEGYDGPEDHGVNAGGPTKGNPRSLATRISHVDAHLWAAKDGTPAGDIGEVERLLAALVQSAKAQAWGAFTVDRGMWKAQEGQAITQLGRAYVLGFTFRIPVPDATATTATITSLPQTMTVGT